MISTAFNKNRPSSPFILNKTFDFDSNDQNEQNINEYKSSLNYYNEHELILRIIKESNFNKNADLTSYFRIKNLQLVKNCYWDDIYLNKKREMKAQRTQIQERFTYFTTDSIEMVNDILKNGFSCSPNDLNILGDSTYGITVIKHLDIELENRFKKKSNNFYCIMAKSLIGKTCLIEPSSRNIQATPNFLADCHLSKEITTQSQSFNIRYNNSLIYLYDYNKNCCLNQKLRNLIPFALLEFELNNTVVQLSKSISYFNLAEIISRPISTRKSLRDETIDTSDKPITFEKTPAWRDLYERSGNFTNVLRSYLKEVRPNLKQAQNHIIGNHNQKFIGLKRSKSISYIPDSKHSNHLTKSATCFQDIYAIDDRSLSKEDINEYTEVFEDENNYFFESTLKPQTSSLLINNKMKRRRSYSASMYEDISQIINESEASKRRLNTDINLNEFEFSSDYSYYSSFSSVFESTQSSNSKSETNNNLNNSQIDSNDIVYLNDCSGEIFLSQTHSLNEEKYSPLESTNSPNEEQYITSQSSISSTADNKELNEFDPSSIDFSIPPPRITPYCYNLNNNQNPFLFSFSNTN